MQQMVFTVYDRIDIPVGDVTHKQLSVLVHRVDIHMHDRIVGNLLLIQKPAVCRANEELAGDDLINGVKYFPLGMNRHLKVCPLQAGQQLQQHL